jgi:hypothetical protein
VREAPVYMVAGSEGLEPPTLRFEA